MTLTPGTYWLSVTPRIGTRFSAGNTGSFLSTTDGRNGTGYPRADGSAFYRGSWSANGGGNYNFTSLNPHDFSIGVLGTYVPGGAWNNFSNANNAWSQGVNWAGFAPPTTTASATFGLASAYTVAIDSSAKAKDLTVSAGQVTFDATGGDLNVVNDLRIDGPAGTAATITGGPVQAGVTYLGYNTTGRLNVAGGSFTSADHIYVGRNGTGTIDQTGGAVSTANGNHFWLGFDKTAKGTYTLSGGTLSVSGDEFIGESGQGTFTQTGGTHTAGRIRIADAAGSSGNLTISGGTLNAAGLYIGGGPTANGGAGQATINPGVTLATTDTKVWNNSSTLNLAGGTLKTKNLDLGGVGSRLNWTGGTLELTGGTFTWPGPGGTTPINLPAGGLLTGSGIVWHSVNVLEGGTIRPAGSLNVSSISGNGTIDVPIGRTFLGGFCNFQSMTVAGTANLGVDSGLLIGSKFTLQPGATLTSGRLRLLQNGEATFSGTFSGWTSISMNVFGATGGVLTLNGAKLSPYSSPSALYRADIAVPVQLTSAGTAIEWTFGDLLITQPISDAGTGSTPGTITKTGLGTLILQAANTYQGTTIVQGGSVSVSNQSNIFTNAGGLDIQAGRAQIGFASETGSLSKVLELLKAGYLSGFKSGPIRSSTATDARGLGLARPFSDGSDACLVAAVYYGDANFDGTVNFNDFLILQNNFGLPNTIFSQGDFNYSGGVDFNDFLILQNNFGKSLTGTSVALTAEQSKVMAAFATTVPEPGTTGVAGAIGAALIGRRRRL